MATNRTFSDMLNEYLPNELLFEELITRDYVLQKVKRRDDWKGGKLIVPFMGSFASSVAFGSLTADTDIAESDPVRGYISDYIETWATLQFNHRDLMDHSGRIPESTFLRILPNEIERMMKYLKQVVSVQLGTGPHFATATVDGTAGGVLAVDRIDRFTLQQKLTLQDSDTAAASYYVIAISIDASTITVSATRGGAAADISAYTVANGAKVYQPGITAAGGGYTSIRDALLSLANGGSTNIHNVAKTAYPHLQAVNVSGASVTSSNILDKLFDFYTTVRSKAKGNANTFLMSYKHLGSIMKLIETQKGPFSVSKQPSASQYGWTEIEITSVRGSLMCVGIQEWDDDVIAAIDWDSMTFNTNGGFKKRAAPDGREYFEIRATTGFKYLVDICLFGEMSFEQPGHNGILHSISY